MLLYFFFVLDADKRLLYSSSIIDGGLRVPLILSIFWRIKFFDIFQKIFWVFILFYLHFICTLKKNVIKIWDSNKLCNDMILIITWSNWETFSKIKSTSLLFIFDYIFDFKIIPVSKHFVNLFVSILSWLFNWTFFLIPFFLQYFN